MSPSQNIKYLINIPSYYFFLLIALACPSLASAQYDEIRFPQDKDEISRYRKLRVSIEEKITRTDSITPELRTTRIFDTFGRIIRSVTPYNHRIYTYDEKGRLIEYIDSAKGMDEFERADNEFEYSPDGRLSFARVSPYSLTFKYNPEKKMLFESTMIDYEQYRQRYFYYDAQERLKREEWLYPNKKPEMIRSIALNRSGKPFQEIVLKYFLNGGMDSDLITYRYDDKLRVLEKKVISNSISVPTGYDSLPILTYSESDTTDYIYTYNIQGNKSSEAFHYSISGYDHKFEWWFDKIGLKDEEIYYDGKGKVKSRSTFKFSFHPTPLKTKQSAPATPKKKRK